MYRLRFYYWSCSRVSDKLRKFFRLPIKPLAATNQQWASWHAKCKLAHRLVHWICEYGLDFLQDIVNFPKDLYFTVYYAVRARFFEKTYMMDSGFNRWAYHDIPEVMLYACFNKLKDFVEIECAQLYKLVFEKEGTGVDWLKYRHADYIRENLETDDFYLDCARLYEWWTINRPARDTSNPNEYYNKLADWDKEDDEMLTLLVKYRIYLWT